VGVVRFQGVGDAGELGFGREPFGEDHVGAGVEVGAAARDSGVEAFDTPGVGAGADDEAGTGGVAGGGGAGDFFLHVIHGHEGLTVEVAAALGEYLILDVKSRGAGEVVLPESAAHHLGFSEAGVGVGEDGEASGAGDLADDEAELVEREEADIGEAEGSRDGGARDIAALKAGPGDGAGDEAAIGAGESDAVGVHEGAEAMARRDHRRR